MANTLHDQSELLIFIRFSDKKDDLWMTNKGGLRLLGDPQRLSIFYRTTSICSTKWTAYYTQ